MSREEGAGGEVLGLVGVRLTMVPPGLRPVQRGRVCWGAVARFAWEDRADPMGCNHEPGKAVS